MKILQEISSIIAEHSPDFPDLILKSRAKLFENNFSHSIEAKDQAYYRAYNGIVSQNVVTEDGLRDLIFPKGTSDVNFRSFKSRLKKRLLHSLMLIRIEPETVSNTDAAEGEVLHLLYIAYVSSVYYNDFVTKEIKDIAIGIARKYDFFFLELRLLELQLQLSLTNGTKREIEKYYKEWLLVKEKHALLLSISDIHYKITLLRKNKLTTNDKLITAYRGFLNEVTNILHICEFDIAFSLYCGLSAIIFLTCMEFKKVLDICDEYEDYLTRKPHFNSPARQLFIAEHRQGALFHLGEYIRSKEIMEAALTDLPISRKKLQTIKRLYNIHYAVYAGDCEYAFDQCMTLLKKQNVQWLDEQRRSHIVLLRTYLWLAYFLQIAESSKYRSGSERQDIAMFASKRPNISTIRNDIPGYEHDKPGAKSTILMFEIILKLIEAKETIIFGNHDEENPLSNESSILHELENAFLYFKLHVPKNQKRVFAFAEIIKVFSRNLYDSGKILRKKVEKHRKKLPSTFVCDDIELLPFDVLTDHLILWWDKSGKVKTATVSKKK